jgi:hypothetical protein
MLFILGRKNLPKGFLADTDSNVARWLIKLFFFMWTKFRQGDGIFKRLIS